MILAETGFLGFISFLFLILSPFREVLRLWPSPEASPESKGAAWGWCLGFAGMLVHNISCISWSIVKASIPYWFLAGAVLSYFAADKQNDAN